MKILNYGSLNIDRVYDVGSFVREGETISCTDYNEYPGGKGLNQTIALARAGAEVYHLGATGRDGESLGKLLAEAGADTRYLEVLPVPSGHAVIQKCRGQNCIIVCGGANQQVSCGKISQTLEDFGPGDLLLLQNETAHVDFAIREAKKRGMQVAFNASPITPELLRYPLDLVDYFLINEVEGMALSGTDQPQPEQILPALRQRFPRAAIVLTLGGEGSRYADGAAELKQVSYPVTVADTTAAGDTFCGYFLAALSRKKPLDRALKEAAMAAAIAVSKNGAAPSIPDMEQVLKFEQNLSDR